MPKMKVQELAKEINKSSNELINILNKMNIEGKSTDSVLEEEEVARIKHVLSRKKRPPEKKKKNIIQVFNPHNSRMSGGPDERLKKKAEAQRAEEELKRKKTEAEQIASKLEAEKKASAIREATMAKIAKKTNSEGLEIKEINSVEKRELSTTTENEVVVNAAEVKVNKKEVEKEDVSNIRYAEKSEAISKTKSNDNSDSTAHVVVKENVLTNEKKDSEKSAAENTVVKTTNRVVRDQSRPNRDGSIPNRDGSIPNRDGSIPNRDGSIPNRDGSRPNRDGIRPNRDGSRPNRDGSRPTGTDRPNYANRTNRDGSRPVSNNRQPYNNRTGYAANRPNNGDRPNRDGSKPVNDRPNRDQSRPSYNNGARPGFNNNGRPAYGNSQNRTDGQRNGFVNRGQRGFNPADKDAKSDDNRRTFTNSKGVGVKKKDALASDYAVQKQKSERGNQRKDGKDKDRQKKDHDRFEQKVNAKSNKNYIKTSPVEDTTPKEEVIKQIILPETLTIREFADKMKIQASVIVKKLFLQGTMVTVNSEIEYSQAEEIALEYNCIAEPEVKIDVIEELLKEEEEDEATLVKRAPVVCVMGHVDHGKTSLLDTIRDTRVTDKEAGGITQAIGAYMVKCNGRNITFLDTPGHEAFTAMRMRGANSTDIAILVVAADDGVMPQTIEAINHAKAAGVEIIVAVNKIDKPNANIQKVLQELTEYDLVAEDFGGSTICVPVSAKTHEGIDTLLEMVLLTADILELKANPNRRARGLVIEAKLDKGKGPVATVLVQKGTLHVGDFIAAGSCYGKVRAMSNDKGKQIKKVGPSTPVEVLGFNDVPQAGDVFVNPETDKEARNFAETFVTQNKEKLIDDTKAKMSLEDLFTEIKAGNLKEINIIVKADVQGSVEAVKSSMLKLSNEEVIVKIIHYGVGAINESDVILASASNAIIIGFNVKPDVMAKATGEREKVDIRVYNVIYDAIADVEAAMKGMLDPVFEEKVIGHAECRQIFKASGIGIIAGSYVLDGIFTRDCKVRISREDEIIFDGPLASLKRFKDDVKEVKSGFECGLVFENFNNIKEDDKFEAYKMVEVPR